ncbi:MAG: hypothetical protein ABI743_11795, partial [bacterium]
MLGADLSLATGSFCRLKHRLPNSAAELLTAKLVFFVPLDTAGKGMSLLSVTSIEELTAAPPEVIPVFLEATTQRLLYRIPGTSDSLVAETGIVPLGDLLAKQERGPDTVPRVPTPVTELRESLLQNPNLSASPHGANSYIWSSDQFNEERLTRFWTGLNMRLQHYILRFGALPTSYPEFLTAMGQSPVNHLSQVQALGLDSSDTWVKVEIDSSRSVVRFTKKPTLPAVDTYYARYVWQNNGSG